MPGVVDVEVVIVRVDTAEPPGDRVRLVVLNESTGGLLVAGAIPFAILAVTIIFSAQNLLLITTLQAIGKTKSTLVISLAATIIDLAAVVLGAPTLGTTAGALGRTLLVVTVTLLA